jgi:hypothetical protein
MTVDEALKQFRDYREDGVPSSGGHVIPKDIQESCARQLGISLNELQSWRKSDIRDKIRAGELVF